MATDTAQKGRATVRPDKAAAVAEIAEAFRTSTAAVLTEYRGLTVKQFTALRVVLGTDTSFNVVKNTLTKLAAGEAGVEGIDALLAGPTAVAFVKGDPVEAAKGLRDFAKLHPALVVKGGVLDGKPMTADEIRKLADLESREVLLSKMAGALLASLTNAARLFNAPIVKAAQLAEALRVAAEADPSIIGGTGVAEVAPAAEAEPVAESTTDETVTDEAPAAETTTDETTTDETPAVESSTDGETSTSA